jgi:hypothetical protein
MDNSLAGSHRGEMSFQRLRRQRVFRRVVAIAWTLIILTLCWIPRAVVHTIERDGSFFQLPNFDKFVHAGIFAVFAITWLRSLRGSRAKFIVGLSGVLLAVLTEVVQESSFIRRDASLGDVVADSTGLLLGLFVAPYLQLWLDRLEPQLWIGSESLIHTPHREPDQEATDE